MFSVGQKVVCIDAKANGQYLPAGSRTKISSLSGLQLGKVYTIRQLGDIWGVPGCRLSEITRYIEPLLGEEMYFAQARFRPVVERKTSIEIFTRMLKPEAANA